VQRFGFLGDRLAFPRAQTHRVEGRSGKIAYGAADCAFEALESRLDSLRWSTDSASLGKPWLRDDAGRVDVAVDRAELPHGIVLVRGDRGVELLSPHVTLSELRLTAKGPFRRGGGGSSSPSRLRQERLRFLDSLSGRIYLTVKVQFDLPVLGVRTLDQQLRVPIQEGSLDYRALENSLDWLEGAFLDLKHEDQRLAINWKVPIFGSSHELISWALDTDASTLAAFGRVPVRSLADFRMGSGSKPSDDSRKRKMLQAFTLDAIEVALSLLAPRKLEIGAGTILFGGEDQPGLVDLKLAGAIRAAGAGNLKGAIGTIDTTISDLRLGPVAVTADRLCFDGLDQLEVTFDGFSPSAITVVIHRVTATNLVLKIGR
jgi:hypothetical protein